MGSNSSGEFDNTPPNILNCAQKASENLLPEKSTHIYEQKYNIFIEWCRKNKVTKYLENVILAYIAEELKSCKPSTLWSIYSMLKSTLKYKNNVDISNFNKLIAFIKQKNKGCKARKSKIFEREHLINFLLNAPDSQFLMIEVGFIIGISGACRREELCKMTINDVEDKKTVYIIKIPETKNGMERIFMILNPNNSSVDYLSFIKKYTSLRPSNINCNRLFLKYANGKCSKQPLGINSFGKMPYVIATYLNLPNPTAFTGHCFRRSSATMLENSGGDLLTVKKHGGWKSSAVAEGYMDSTITQKNKISNKLLMDDSMPSTSKQSVSRNYSFTVEDDNREFWRTTRYQNYRNKITKCFKLCNGKGQIHTFWKL